MPRDAGASRDLETLQDALQATVQRLATEDPVFRKRFLEAAQEHTTAVDDLGPEAGPAREAMEQVARQALGALFRQSDPEGHQPPGFGDLLHETIQRRQDEGRTTR